MPKLDNKLQTQIKQSKVGKKPKRLPPLWEGPGSDGAQGGVTQSLLGRYLSCAERFRIRTIEGLRPMEDFSARMEYGHMWHLCEETYWGSDIAESWKQALQAHAHRLRQKYPTQGSQIEQWRRICELQFPIYLDFWSKQKEQVKGESILQEKKFNVRYVLPSGRVVFLRGMWDEVKVVYERNKPKYILLKETKTKGDPDRQKIVADLQFDLQTQMYLVALREWIKTDHSEVIYQEDLLRSLPISGVNYNVIRRPLSGGRHTIRQHKPSNSNPAGESEDVFYNRLAGLIKGEPEFFFDRFSCDVSPGDLDKFQHSFLNPVLENLLDDYEWWSHCHHYDQDHFNYLNRDVVFPWHSPRHYRYPFGVYNPTLEGYAADTDEYLATGSTLGLARAETLFSELE